MLNHKSILITGGTGSFGEKFTDITLKRYPDIDIGKYYVIMSNYFSKQDFLKFYAGSREVDPGFSFSSGKNSEWISVEQMRELIREHVYPGFKPFE